MKKTLEKRKYIIPFAAAGAKAFWAYTYISVRELEGGKQFSLLLLAENISITLHDWWATENGGKTRCVATHRRGFFPPHNAYGEKVCVPRRTFFGSRRQRKAAVFFYIEILLQVSEFSVWNNYEVSRYGRGNV